jgi:hypothetical protein
MSGVLTNVARTRMIGPATEDGYSFRLHRDNTDDPWQIFDPADVTDAEALAWLNE